MNRSGRRKTKRPITISLAGTITLAVAGFHLYHGITQLFAMGVFNAGYPLLDLDFRLKPDRLIGRGFLESLLSILALIILVNFFRLRRWSWVALVLWVTINLVIDLETYFYAEANFLSMIANVIVAFSILQSDVQVIFGIRKTDEQPGFSF